MTLKEFLETLKSDHDVVVTVTDRGGNEVCKIYASSYDALDTAIEAREIDRWAINSSTQVSIVLADAE